MSNGKEVEDEGAVMSGKLLGLLLFGITLDFVGIAFLDVTSLN